MMRMPNVIGVANDRLIESSKHAPPSGSHSQETADAHNLQLGNMLDDAGMVGTATPAGKSQVTGGVLACLRTCVRSAVYVDVIWHLRAIAIPTCPVTIQCKKRRPP